MRILGIVAEYHPFHNGHRYHLEEAKKQTKAEYCVAVMSGNFMQRGEPALWDKRFRAKMAVENGVNLVIELPFAFACNNAEQFAYGGVSILNCLGCITDLAFGCEGNPKILKRIAKRLSNEDLLLKNALKTNLDRGLSYPAARAKALSQCGEEEGAALLTQPNNILAVEYLKQCFLNNSKINPLAIERKGAHYHDDELNHQLASATAIRIEWLKHKDLDKIRPFIPQETADVIKKINISDNVFLNDFYNELVWTVRTASKEMLSEIWAATEGLEHLLKKSIIVSTDMASLIEEIKSKRYTRTRITRLLMQTLMGLSKEDYNKILKDKINYAHVLAFDKKGAQLLRYIKKSNCASIPIYSNFSKEVCKDAKEHRLLKYDLLATDLYHLAQGKRIYDFSDLVLVPYYKKD